MASKPQRNLNPHKPARVAMSLYGVRYAVQNGGSMDFWDSLKPGEKDICRRIAKQIMEAPDEQN